VFLTIFIHSIVHSHFRIVFTKLNQVLLTSYILTTLDTKIVVTMIRTHEHSELHWIDHMRYKGGTKNEHVFIRIQNMQQSKKQP